MYRRAFLSLATTASSRLVQPARSFPLGLSSLRTVASTATSVSTDPAKPAPVPTAVPAAEKSACGDVDDDDDDDEYEEMFVRTNDDRLEWGGPLRGGRMLEPTRFGDWERKGRCTDF